MEITQEEARVPVVTPGKMRGFFREARRYPVIPIAILIVVLVIPAIFAPWIAPHDPLDGNLPDRLIPPVWSSEGTWDHVLGTDKQGRDILSRIYY